MQLQLASGRCSTRQVRQAWLPRKGTLSLRSSCSGAPTTPCNENCTPVTATSGTLSDSPGSGSIGLYTGPLDPSSPRPLVPSPLLLMGFMEWPSAGGEVPPSSPRRQCRLDTTPVWSYRLPIPSRVGELGSLSAPTLPVKAWLLDWWGRSRGRPYSRTGFLAPRARKLRAVHKNIRRHHVSTFIDQGREINSMVPWTLSVS